MASNVDPDSGIRQFRWVPPIDAMVQLLLALFEPS